MKQKFISCDVCGKKIGKHDIRYKFKQYSDSKSAFAYIFLSETTAVKHKKKLDICKDCFEGLQKKCKKRY